MDMIHIYNFILKGGPLIWPILFCSVMGVAIFLERLYYISKLKKLDHDIITELEQGRCSLEIGEGQARKRGPLTRMFLDASKIDPKDKKGLETVFDYHIDATLSDASRGLDMLATLAAISPLLGLLGTVTGLIKAFMVIEKAGGQVNAHSLAGGIWEAMLTTAVGLSVAIPLIVAHKILMAKLKGLEDNLQHTSFTYIMALQAPKGGGTQ